MRGCRDCKPGFAKCDQFMLSFVFGGQHEKQRNEAQADEGHKEGAHEGKKRGAI